MGKELEEKKGLGEIVSIRAEYDGKNLSIEKSHATVSEIKGEFYKVIRLSGVGTHSVWAKKLNIAFVSEMDSKEHLIVLQMLAYKISEFQIRLELRRCFLEAMENKRNQINQLINNFEEVFESQIN